MPSPFEALIWAVLGQQISVAFAYALKRALVERYGEGLEHEGRVYRLFPTPERLAAVSPDELRGLQFSRQKAEYVVGLAGLVATGGIPWADLRDAPTPDAVAALSSHRGIGRWTARPICMRGLGHPDVLRPRTWGLAGGGRSLLEAGVDATEPSCRRLAELGRLAQPLAFCWWYWRGAGAAAADDGQPGGPPG